MAHFVEIDASNIVIRGVVLDDKDTQNENGDEVESVGAKYLADGLGGTWKRTSRNTLGNIHSSGKTPFRKNYAGIGYIYDEGRDAFIPPQPFPSWTLNEVTCNWVSPVPHPDTGGDRYIWNEETKSWDEVETRTKDEIT